ncbi:hypothetical protein [Halomonas faecis]|uniref:hypothetical protein n=1 Tax=Halomonas faecis TaxID=1562110 RepID=UPI0013D06D60|nr:hypothetical protein [Halomonas faecis]
MDNFTSKTGLNVDIYNFEICGKKGYELISSSAPSDKYMLYLHGGPNLSCDPYILDTIYGGFRSLENLLRYTNIILIDQKEELTLTRFKEMSKEEGGEKKSIRKIIDSHSPAAYSKVYKEVIEQYLYKYDYGVFAQSFGTQALLCLLDDQLAEYFTPKYLALGSPFLGIDDPGSFVLHRRQKLFHRTKLLRKTLADSPTLKKVVDRGDALGVGDLLKHQLSKLISHPSHPIGVIEKTIEKHIADLNGFDDSRLEKYCQTGSQDLINFVVGSQYFCPGGNIYKATLESMKQVNYSVWMPDEAVIMKYAMEDCLQSTTLLDIDFNFSLPVLDTERLTKLMEVVPTLIYVDPQDFMVPVDRYMKMELMALEEKGRLEVREGYGHWIGHATFGRLLGALR